MDNQHPSRTLQRNGPVRWRGLTLAAVITAALAACGADQDNPRPATTTTPDKPSPAASTDPQDGRLTNTDGEVITDYGKPSERRDAVRMLNRIQKLFRAGHHAAACEHINDFMLSQFIPPGTRADTPCPKKLAAYAAARQRHNAQPATLKVLWIRSYTGEAGIWVDDPQGRRLRIQMTSTGGKNWELDLGELHRPDILAAHLATTNQYRLHDNR